MLATVSRSALCNWLLLALPCLFAVGCNGSDEGGIKTYKLAFPDDKGNGNTDPKRGSGDPAPVENGPAKTRLLGAIIPASPDTSFFVKFVGPIDKIDANEKDFDAFLNSIRVPGEGGKPISWTTPAGWKEGGPRQMRIVTLQKADGSAPDLYISEPFAGGLLQNVNRWRKGDAGLPEIGEADLPGSTKEITLGTLKAHRVDLRGPGGGKGMAPFMGK